MSLESEIPPTLRNALWMLLGTIGSWVLARLASPEGEVVMKTSLIAQVVVPVLSVIIGLSYWVYKLRKEFLSELRHERKNKIQRFREFLKTTNSSTDIGPSIEYSEMRPHLPASSVDAVENRAIIVRPERHGGNVVISQILDDLTELEKKWRLM